ARFASGSQGRSYAEHQRETRSGSEKTGADADRVLPGRYRTWRHVGWLANETAGFRPEEKIPFAVSRLRRTGESIGRRPLGRIGISLASDAHPKGIFGGLCR